MAIKGKKKSQSRGSQARRRPATAPRPPFTARNRVPWYRTDRGRIAAGVAAAVVIGVVWWAVARAQQSAGELDARQAALQSYTGEIEALLQTLRPAAQEMIQVPGRGKVRPGLGGDARRWQAVVEQARAQFARITPTAGTDDAHRLYAQSLSLYLAAARAYRSTAEAEPRAAADLLAAATDERDAADSIWLTATQVLDRERQRAELGASGVGFPATPPLPGSPGASPPAGGQGGEGPTSGGGGGG